MQHHTHSSETYALSIVIYHFITLTKLTAIVSV